LTHPANPPAQYLYPLDNTSQSISELLALNSHQFLADERNSKGGAAGVKLLYEIDLQQATAPTNLTGTNYDGATAAHGLPGKTVPAGIVPLHKTLFANIGSILLSATSWPFTNIDGLDSLPDKIEGYCFGPLLPDGRQLLLATNDNDFVRQGGTAGTGYPDYFFAFAVDTTCIPGFQPVSFQTTGVIKTGAGRLCNGSLPLAHLRRGALLIEGLAGEARLEIYNAAGEKILDLGERKFSGASQEVTVPNRLGTGFYVLRITGSRNVIVPLVRN